MDKLFIAMMATGECLLIRMKDSDRADPKFFEAAVYEIGLPNNGVPPGVVGEIRMEGKAMFNICQYAEYRKTKGA